MLKVYTKNNCGYCEMAKAMLKNNDIPFETVNVEDDADAMKFILEQGLRSMPQIFKGDQLFVQGGYQGMQQMGVENIKNKLNEESIDTSTLGSI